MCTNVTSCRLWLSFSLFHHFRPTTVFCQLFFTRLPFSCPIQLWHQAVPIVPSSCDIQLSLYSKEIHKSNPAVLSSCCFKALSCIYRLSVVFSQLSSVYYHRYKLCCSYIVVMWTFRKVISLIFCHTFWCLITFLCIFVD